MSRFQCTAFALSVRLTDNDELRRSWNYNANNRSLRQAVEWTLTKAVGNREFSNSTDFGYLRILSLESRAPEWLVVEAESRRRGVVSELQEQSGATKAKREVDDREVIPIRATFYFPQGDGCYAFAFIERQGYADVSRMMRRLLVNTFNNNEKAYTLTFEELTDDNIGYSLLNDSKIQRLELRFPAENDPDGTLINETNRKGRVGLSYTPPWKRRWRDLIKRNDGSAREILVGMIKRADPSASNADRDDAELYVTVRMTNGFERVIHVTTATDLVLAYKLDTKETLPTTTESDNVITAILDDLNGHLGADSADAAKLSGEAIDSIYLEGASDWGVHEHGCPLAKPDPERPVPTARP